MTRKAGRRHVDFSVEAGCADADHDRPVIGPDMGVAHPVATSGGDHAANLDGDGVNRAVRNGQRAPARAKRGSNRRIWHPLVAVGAINENVLEFGGTRDFDLRLPAVSGKTIFGNCDGCFPKSEATLAELARRYPERSEWRVRMEDYAVERGEREACMSFRQNAPRRRPHDMVLEKGDALSRAGIIRVGPMTASARGCP